MNCSTVMYENYLFYYNHNLSMIVDYAIEWLTSTTGQVDFRRKIYIF